MIFPGSALARKHADWVMAAELVETSRLWGRTVARVDPTWVEPLAEHLVARTYCEPRWSASRGSVVATERVTLYGLPIVTDRTVQYGRIDPRALARAVHPQGAGGGRVARPARLPGRQPRAARGGRGARAPLAAARHPRRRRGAGRLLRRANPGRRGVGGALRPLVARRAARRPGPADLHPRAADGRRRGGEMDPRDWPETWRQGDLELAGSATGSTRARPTTASPCTCRWPCSGNCGPTASSGSCRLREGW